MKLSRKNFKKPAPKWLLACKIIIYALTTGGLLVNLLLKAGLDAATSAEILGIVVTLGELLTKFTAEAEQQEE